MGTIRFTTTGGDACQYKNGITWLGFLEAWNETPEDGLIPVRSGFFEYDQQVIQKRNVVEISYEED